MSGQIKNVVHGEMWGEKSKAVAYVTLCDDDEQVIDLGEGDDSDLEILPIEILPSRLEAELKASAFKEKGNEHLQKKDYDCAIEAYTKAIALCPNDPVFYSNRSAAFLMKGDARSALKNAEKCIEVDRMWPKGYSRKGAALYNLKQFECAVEAYEKGLEITPTDIVLQDGLAKTEKMIAVASKNRSKDKVSTFPSSSSYLPSFFHPTETACLVCTFLNEPTAKQCAICGSIYLQHLQHQPKTSEPISAKSVVSKKRKANEMSTPKGPLASLSMLELLKLKNSITECTVSELKDLLKSSGIKGSSRLNKPDLINKALSAIQLSM